MELDVVDLFGDREAESAGDSAGESDTEQQQQQPNFLEEGNNDGQGEEDAGGAPAAAGESIKVKKVVKNPLPKLDAHRLAGPRGMFALHKIFRNFKFKGKGNECADLQELLKMLEHWAHRLYPKLPFKDTLEQIEKLGTQKSVQVNMKKLRLDMYVEDDGQEDNVRRGTDDDNSETVPVVDVFDELLGITPSAQSTTTTTTPTATATMLPASQPPRPTTQLTQEQRERMERNRMLAIERRLARVNQQQQESQQQRQEQENEESSSTTQPDLTTSQVMDHFDNLLGSGNVLHIPEDTRKRPDNTEELMDGIADKLEDPEERRETQETQNTEELMDVFDKLQGSGETISTQERREAPDNTEGVNGDDDQLQVPVETICDELLETVCDEPVETVCAEEERKEASDDTEVMNGDDDDKFQEALETICAEEERREIQDDTKVMNGDDDKSQEPREIVCDEEERRDAPDDTEELTEPLNKMSAETPHHQEASDQVMEEV